MTVTVTEPPRLAALSSRPQDVDGDFGTDQLILLLVATGRARPEVTGPLALRSIPGEGYFLQPRLDRLNHDQISRLHGAEADLAADTVRRLHQLHQAYEQGVDPSEVPSQFLDQDLVVIGTDGQARLHEDVILALNPE